jgi:hypothetical protein
VTSEGVRRRGMVLFLASMTERPPAGAARDAEQTLPALSNL